MILVLRAVKLLLTAGAAVDELDLYSNAHNVSMRRHISIFDG